MRLQWVRQLLPIIVGTAIAAALALPSTAASPPNFDIVATGAVGFGCWNPADPFPIGCFNPPAYRIFGTADAEGTHIGPDATFTTVEKATPQPPTYTENLIDGNAVVTASNGDEIWIHYHGTSPAPVGDFLHPGQLDDHLDFEITGGTGHFSDARGSGKLTATGTVYYDGRPTIVTSELAGTIKMHPK